LTLGCRDADLLIIDEAMAVHLPTNFVNVASGALRTPRIVVFCQEDGGALPLGPSARQRLTEDVVRVEPTGLTGLVRSVGTAPLMLTMPNPDSYLSKASAGGDRGADSGRAGKKTCPRCGKELNAYAVKCRYCKAEVS